MACCILTAYFMNRIIKACEAFDIHPINIKYNDFDAGFDGYYGAQELTSAFTSTKLKITGMTCGACVGTIEKAIIDRDGVDRVSVSLTLERATVVYDTARVSPADLIAKIEEAGYGAQIGERTAEQNLRLLQHTEELKVLRSSFIGAAVISSAVASVESLRSICLSYEVGRRYNNVLHLSAMLLACWIQVYNVTWIHQNAWAQGRKGLFTMDTLISLSLLLSIALSIFNISLRGLGHAQTYFSSGSFLATVITAGRYLDLLLKRKNIANFTSLYRLQAETALVKLRKNEAYVPAVLLRPQEEIFIEPTSIVPCDCYVLEGTSTVDQSTMTGEPVPVTKTTGDFLLSGTRNISKTLLAVVYKEQRDSTLEQLIESISSATEHKLSGQENVETMTTYFVTGILVLTALGFSVSFWNSSAAWPYVDRINIACERAMAILAASCPCALGLATPSAVMAGIDAAWSQGVLLTGGARTIESLSKITHMVMDKTGTLTEGRLQVSSYHVSTKLRISKELYCRLLCAAEKLDAQAQPVGKALFQWALTQMQRDEKRLQNTAETRNHASVPGKGVSCEVRGSADIWYIVHVGSASFLEDSGIRLVKQEHLEIPSGTMMVYVAVDRQYAGEFVLQDVVRKEAPTVIDAIKETGLDVTMLTGDVPQEARRVSSQLGISVLASRSLPLEKKALIESLQVHGHKVAMVGDGINDSLAQAAADVGILLSLSRACMTGAADVIVMSPNLHALPKLLDISKKTMLQARRNVQWAVVYNVVAISLAMGVFEKWTFSIDASIAGTMMAFSSAAVLSMSLHLRRQLR